MTHMEEHGVVLVILLYLLRGIDEQKDIAVIRS